jgi:membrane-associated protease RseP (regulator of RpoE activity)
VESVVGIVRLASQAAHTGLATVLELLAAINIFIGIFNMVPLLPLDGGHVAIAVYERLRSRKGRRYRVDATKLLPATYLVVVLIMVLGVTAVYLDIAHPLANPFR